MIISGIYFDKDKQGDVVAELLHLPEAIKPVIFSADEGKKPKENLVSDAKKFDAFRKKNPQGYFLYADQATFDVTISSVGRSSVFMELLNTDQSSIFGDYFERLSQAGIEYGFACNNSEYLHRNRHYIESGANKIETWVGRDLTKYIPGLYWQTYISVAIAKQHRFGLEEACLVAEESIDFGKGVLMRFFADPQDWNQYSDKLDKLCLTMDGVFSIKDVNAVVSSGMNFIELNAALSQWK